jgi:hypothetical protein
MSTPHPEKIDGIYDPLPEGERVLWQGAPDWRRLAVTAFHVRKVSLYFGILLAWKIVADTYDGSPLAQAAAGSLWLAALAGAAVGLLALLAWLSARTTIYAVTNRRVFLRIGIALPIFVNLPFTGIDAAALRVDDDGSGDIPLKLKGGVRLAYLHLWPHARAWRLRHPEPMLRSVPEAKRVAQILARALATASGSPAQWTPEADPARAPAPAWPVGAASSRVAP